VTTPVVMSEQELLELIVDAAGWLGLLTHHTRDSRRIRYIRPSRRNDPGRRVADGCWGDLCRTRELAQEWPARLR
jgi:hypothetical protein